MSSTGIGGPAELPAELSDGGGTIPVPRRPGPAELPPFLTSVNVGELAAETFRILDRVHALERSQLAMRLRLPGRPGIGGGPAELPAFSAQARFLPNELPEGGEGSGGGIIPRPGEIAELPIFDVTRLLQEIIALRGLLQSVATEVQGLTRAASAGQG